jgi:DNA-binding NarL/FixJ family response regulator
VHVQNDHDGQVTAFIVANFEPMRRGLSKTLTEAPGITLMGEASTLKEMLDAEGYNADVLVVDVHAIERLQPSAVDPKALAAIPRMKALFLGDAQGAAEGGFESLGPMMLLHTAGFMYRHGPAARLVNAVELVAAGIFVCETGVIKETLSRLAKSAANPPSTEGGPLTERELEVLRLIARGRSNREIANELFMSEGTVKAHVSHIMEKTGADRRAGLVRFAFEAGISLEED